MTNTQNLKTALESGTVDFIKKPIDRIELLARIKSMLVLIKTLKELEKKDKIILEQEKLIIEEKLDRKNRKLISYTK